MLPPSFLGVIEDVLVVEYAIGTTITFVHQSRFPYQWKPTQTSKSDLLLFGCFLINPGWKKS